VDLIIGAGLSGLSRGYKLKEKRKDFRILEKDDRVGGLCKTERVDDFLFDYTGHFLYFKNKDVKKLVFNLLKNRIEMYRRNSWIYSKGVFTLYPFQKNLYGLPDDVIRECIDGLISAKKNRSTKPNNFEEWILQGFGEGIFKHFMAPYNSKLFTVPPRDMTTEWVSNYVPKVSVRDLIDGAKSPRYVDNAGYNAFFYYPKEGGIESLPKAFESKIDKYVIKNSGVTSIDTKKKIVETVNCDIYDYENLISTIPLPEIIKILKDVPSKIKNNLKELDWVSVYNLNIGLNKELDNDKHWIYFPEYKYPFYRVGSLSNITKSVVPSGCSSLYTEFSYSKHRLIPKDIDDLIIKNLVKLGIIKEKNIIVKKSLDIKYAYVIYNKKWSTVRNLLKEYLKKNGIETIGRYGAWEYSAMEDAIA
jgi:protoporphyrinogen oxidase